MWVQVHDITIKFLSREVAKKLCEVVGEVKRDMNQMEVELGEVMRIRDRVDVTLPIYYGRFFFVEKWIEGMGFSSNINVYLMCVIGVAA